MQDSGEDAGEDGRLAALLAGHRILFCHGLLGEVADWLHPFGMDYMHSQADWLRRIGLTVAVVRLRTGAPVGVNAGRIAAAIAADPRPVVLVGHSKGGLDALAALLLPGIATRCRGFIALQSPFHGSPMADAICARRWLHLALHRLGRLTRLGTGQGLRDLTTSVRQAWMQDRAAAIGTLVAMLPCVALATVLERRWRRQEAVFLLLARCMERQGARENDGLVSVASARLPGAAFELLEGGHRALVTAGPGRDPVGVLRRQLLWVAEGGPCGPAAIPPRPRPAPVPHPRSR
jgi:hypothetical protein